MRVTSAKDFFYKYINVNSANMAEEYKLTHKEILFLVECCMYNYEGKDLNNLRELAKHFVSIKFFVRETDVSIYKYKLSLKCWAKSTRTTFELPGILNKKLGDKLEFNLKLEFVDELPSR